MDSHRRASGVLVVDLDALARNYGVVCRAAAPAECGAVVKADAYGLGMEAVARRLFAEGCRSYFVATLAEGLELRTLLPRARIFVFEGAVADSAPELAAAALVPVLNTLAQVERWAKIGGAAALHVDTGMSRLGLSAAEVATLAAEPARLAGIEIECVLTHLACADEPEHRLNAAQLADFERLRAELPAAKTSIGNSACAFLGAEYHGDLVRAGIVLYGGNPFLARPSPVESVVRLSATILQVREIELDVTIGYGATYAARGPARIAVAGIGYADGLPRCLGNKGAASVAGVRVPIAGRVSMDLLCLDVSALPADAVSEGMVAHFIGGGISVDEVADTAGTISYEILTGLGARLQREYRGAAGEEAT